MREFTVRYGRFEGKHVIYDTIKEAQDNGISTVISPWYSADTGDWAVSDDGYVSQVLSKYVLKNKNHRSGQYTDCFVFPQGTFYVYYDKDKQPHVKNFYAALANSNRNSLGNTSKLGKYLGVRKKTFVTLLASGMDTSQAYIQAFKPKAISPKSIFLNINQLLRDPKVREELMNQLKPFIDKVEVKIREKTGYDNLTDFLVAQMSELLVDMSLSAKEKRANIKLIIDLFGEQLGIVTTRKTNIKSIEEAQFEELAPPQLN